MISNIKVGDESSPAKDVLGRVYKYVLLEFASAQGKKGGEFYTPRCVVKLLEGSWQYGTPPMGNANFAWAQQVVHQWACTETLASRVMRRSEVA